MSKFVLTDAAIERALAPGLDVSAPADFTSRISSAIATQPRRARSWFLGPVAWPRLAPQMTQLLLLLLLILALFLGALAIASQPRRGLSNGNVVLAQADELLTIDPQTGVSRTLLTGPGKIFGVARSLDGTLISFWTQTPGAHTLEIVGADGSGRRRVATDVIPKLIGEDQIDVWSADGRWLAAGVVAGAAQRIVLIDVATGHGELIGPAGAANPLFSPDGQRLAASYERDGRSVLAVMRRDGSDWREISGDVGPLEVSGTNNWSPDGVWVYVGAAHKTLFESKIFRVNVAGAYAEQLTADDEIAVAPALSPDGKFVVYARFHSQADQTLDLYVMDADGANGHLLLQSARNFGWSNDSQFVLAEWRPANAAYELLILHPDGTGRRTLMTFEGGCPAACVEDLAWGQPRP